MKFRDEQEDFEFRWRVVLSLLSRTAMSRTALYRKFAAKTEGSPSTFLTTFDYLVQTGRIQKSSNEHLAPYIITKSGRQFLDCLVGKKDSPENHGCVTPENLSRK